MGNVESVIWEKFEEELCQIFNKCEKKVNEEKFGPGGKPDYKWCDDINSDSGKKNRLELGTEKHKCFEKEVNEKKEDAKSELSKKKVQAEEKLDACGGGKIKPDVIVGEPPIYDAVYDFKTSCPLTSKSEGKWTIYKKGTDNPPPNSDYDGRSQAEAYKDACRVKPKIIHPHSDACTGQLSLGF